MARISGVFEPGAWQGSIGASYGLRLTLWTMSYQSSRRREMKTYSSLVVVRSLSVSVKYEFPAVEAVMAYMPPTSCDFELAYRFAHYICRGAMELEGSRQ